MDDCFSLSLVPFMCVVIADMFYLRKKPFKVSASQFIVLRDKETDQFRKEEVFQMKEEAPKKNI